jgi:acetyltransferase-like isoleucine patch superfamily enzyme
MAQRFEKDTELIKYAYEELTDVPRGSDDYEKMISGMHYNCLAPELNRARLLRHEMARKYSNICLDDKTEEEFTKERYDYLRKIFGKVGENAYMEPPFNVDYGFNISIGDWFYANFNLTILDTSIVKIGNHVQFGPNCVVTCATHHLDPIERCEKFNEWAREITLDDYVWLGANVSVLQGAVIGEGAVIGANSVVTAGQVIPPYTVCVGAPARIIRKIKGYSD